MNFLSVTLPISIGVAAILVGIVIWALRDGAFDDWEGPAARHHFDDDETPEIEPPLRERAGSE
ncbi:MAG: cbb3-type cytochrome oxidase assembly protein CcoS [Myxococcota bacterium]|nr:cbb3-type cytochrome oxidase assembly protein CcoS [Myxococcota bacterium]